MQKKYPNLKWKAVWDVLYLFEAKTFTTRQAREALQGFGISKLDAEMLVNLTALHGYSPQRYVRDWES